jgi:hypothetical protein
MTKVVYNSCYGGFSFSDRACARLVELGVTAADNHGSRSVGRHDPLVIQVVEELGADASGRCARLAITTIEGDRYRIDEYDGIESVQEPNDLDWVKV